MGAEQQQEVKSLPRNRKCGNCRYFEPAPLWRKGWCRNPQLYPPHANHLVDSATIDCEGGFRSRIYWEPIPQAVPVQTQSTIPVPKQPTVSRVRNAPPAQPTQPIPTQPSTPGQARSGAFGPRFESAAPPTQPTQSQPTRPQPQVRSFRPQSFEPPAPAPQAEEIYYDEPEISELESYQEVEPAPPPVTAYRRPTTRRAPAIETEPSPPTARARTDWREGMRRNFPFTQSWNLENVKPLRILPWLLVAAVALVILLVVIPSNNKHTGTPLTTDDNATPGAAISVTSDSSAGVGTAAPVTTPRASVGAAAGSPNSKTPASGTVKPTTGTVIANPPVVAGNPIAGKTGTVNSADGINVRKDPSKAGAVLLKLKKGDKVTLLDGPKSGDGLDWYQIKSGETTGWVAKDFIDVSA